MSLIPSFSDMDVVFALAYNEGVSPVAVSLRKDVPLAGSPEANKILGFSSDSSETYDQASGLRRRHEVGESEKVV